MLEDGIIHSSISSMSNGGSSDRNALGRQDLFVDDEPSLSIDDESNSHICLSPSRVNIMIPVTPIKKVK